tara:strand:+ start:8425 stop:8610 length:186 start_codon:yes stop_codon:yes gene_type:complete
MASFLLGVLTGVLIEEVCRWGARKMDNLKDKIDALPDVVPAFGIQDDKGEVKDEVEVLKEN